MNKMLTLSQRCSPNLLTEQLTQQQLYIRLIAKLFKLLRSLDTLSNLFNLLTPMSTLSSFAETRMDRSFDKDVQVNILDEQVGKPGGGQKSMASPFQTVCLIKFSRAGVSEGGVPLAVCRRLQCKFYFVLKGDGHVGIK